MYVYEFGTASVKGEAMIEVTVWCIAAKRERTWVVRLVGSCFAPTTGEALRDAQEMRADDEESVPVL